MLQPLVKLSIRSSVAVVQVFYVVIGQRRSQMMSRKEARCRGGLSVPSGELMPLLGLEWRLEGAFTWTVTKHHLEFVLTLPLAVSLMVRSGDNLRAFTIIVSRLRLEKLSWGVDDMCINWLSGWNKVVRTDESELGASTEVSQWRHSGGWPNITK